MMKTRVLANFGPGLIYDGGNGYGQDCFNNILPLFEDMGI